MKKIVLEPSYENLIDTFLKDSISRSSDVCAFVDLLSNVEDSISVGLDGKWGVGKTFFVKQAKLVLDSFNKNGDFYEAEDAKKIREKYSALRQNSNVDSVPEVTAYYDAWMHDDEEEPMLSLLYEIMKDNYNKYPGNSKSWSDILTSVAGVVCDRDIGTLVKALKGKDIFEEQKQNENLNKLLGSFFESLLPERGNRLVVFIDELDRCSPVYAVKLLERIKHFFSCENITFVFSINFTELHNTVKNFYGADFDACRYMDRFFDIRMEIPSVDMEKYIKVMGDDGGRCPNFRQVVCDEIIKQMHMSMREASRFLQMSRACAYKYTDGDQYENNRIFSHDDGMSELIGYSVIAQIAIGLKITNAKEYDDFMSGKDSLWLENILLSDSMDGWVKGYFLSDDEDYRKIDGRKQVTELQKIREVYEAIFVKKYARGEYETRIGKLVFEKGFKEKVIKAIGLVSTYTDYSV